MHRMLYIFAVKITFKHRASLLHNCMQVIACENFYFCRLLQFLARRFQALPYINYMSVKKCLKVDYLPTPYSYLVNMFIFTVSSVLWSCWLGGRKGIRPVKNWLVWCWRGYLVWLSVCSEVQTCIWPRWCHCHSLSCFIKIQIGFTFLVLAYPGSPGQRAVKRVYVWIYLLC